MIQVGFFKEMGLYKDIGSITEYLVEDVNYDKEKVIAYLETQNKVASCPRNAIDCLSGKIISSSFSVYNDADKEYEWCDFLPYHIRKYNVRLPENFLEKIEKDTRERVRVKK